MLRGFIRKFPDHLINSYGDHISQATTNEVEISAISYPAFSKSIDYETPDFIDPRKDNRDTDC